MGRDTHLVWRHLTRQPGGAVLALATDGQTVLAGTASGAFLARHDADTWETLALPDTWGRLELANPVVIAPWGDRYIATPLGLFRQQPNGNWQRCLEGGTIVAIRAVADGTRRLVIVADQLDGILVSSNAGTDWEPANAGLPQLVEIVDLTLSPQFERDRTAMLVTADGIYLSRSRRWSWHEIESAPAMLECGAIAVDEHGRLTLLAGGEGGLFRSRDRGRTWEAATLPVEGSCSALATDPTGHSVAAAIDRHVIRSPDGGDTWQRLPDVPSHILSLAILDSERLVAGTLAQGCLRWETSTAAWLSWNSGLYGRLPVGLVTRRTGELVIADYSGTIFQTVDRGETWQTVMLERGIAQFAGGTSGPVFALALDALLRSHDGRAWETVHEITDLSESAWLVVSDDGRTVFLVQYTLEETLQPLVSLVSSMDSGNTWHTDETDTFAHVQGAALAPDGRALALLALHADSLHHTLSVLSTSRGRWHHHRWPETLPETTMARLLWSVDGEALLVVIETDVWLVHRPLERPRIARIGRLDSPASALGRAGNSGWFLAAGARLWYCEASGKLRALAPDQPEQTIVALAGDPASPVLSGYAADVGGNVWWFSLVDGGVPAAHRSADSPAS